MLRKNKNQTPAKAPGKKAAPKTKKGQMSPEDIHALTEKRAFELYCKRDENSSDHVQDWLLAEKLVRKELRV